ncbi:MAG TPA: hypothetical protein VEH29_12725 [Acidimicrobiales bacterium]|nr:hypothetical protein [Acidimicrobiales bacterium]
MAAFDAKKLSPMDWGVVGGGFLALVSLFLPWWGISSGPFSYSTSGWGTSWGWLGALLIIAAGVYVLLLRSGVKFPALPVGPGVLVLGTAVLGTVIILLRWLTVPRGSFGAYGGYGTRIGIYIALVAGIGQAVCSFKLFSESGEALPWAAQHPTGTPTASGPGPSFGAPPGQAFSAPTPTSDFSTSAPAQDYSAPAPDYGVPGSSESGQDPSSDDGGSPTV